MTTILVTGARGFVGRALVPELLKQNLAVKAISRARIVQESDELLWITLPITPETNWQAVLKDVDVVIHLADGLRAFEKANKKSPPDGPKLVEATLNFARAAVGAGVKRFIYVSSIKAAAGETADRTLDETTEPAPNSKYGYMKQKCEKALLALTEKTPMELTIVRNPIVYGPGATNNMARLLKIADTFLPVPFKALENRRSIISASNLASALTAAAKYPGDGSGIFYVHDGDRLSTGEILNIFRQELGRKKLEFGVSSAVWMLAKKLPIVGQTARRLTGTLLVTDLKFRRHFQWAPKETSDAALTKMARAYKAFKRRKSAPKTFS